MIEDRNSIKILESYPAGPASSYTGIPPPKKF